MLQFNFGKTWTFYLKYSTTILCYRELHSLNIDRVINSVNGTIIVERGLKSAAGVP